MKTALGKIIHKLRKVDPLTGFPECMLIGYSNVSSQSEHIARYLFARSYAKGSILDLAASSCYGSSILASNGSNYVVSADLNADALLYGKTVFPRKNREAVRCDAGHLPFKIAAFDAIVSIETIEHLQNQAMFLKSVRRVLKPLGLIILSTPNKIVSCPILQTPINPYHNKEYGLKEISSLFEGLGLKIVRVFFQTRTSIINFLARVPSVFLASLFVKLRIGIMPLRYVSKVFYIQQTQPLDPNPSIYPICRYTKLADCFVNFQMIIIARNPLSEESNCEF